jgi:hypothetical protein
MTNEFGDRLDRLDRLERKRANDHDEVQNRPKRREFIVRRALSQVNTDVDEFVADNDTSSVDFENIFVGHGEHFAR